MPRINKVCVACKKDKFKDKKEFRRGQIICVDCENLNVEYEKECIECKEMLQNTMFRKNTKKCMECHKAYGRNYRRTTTKAKEWTENNREKMSQLQSNWYQKNKKNIREKEQDRYKNDEDFRITRSYRSSVQKFIKGTIKSNKRLSIDRDLYVEWLEYCFNEDMCINNYSELWQIDHVIPLDKLKDKYIQKNEAGDCLLRWYNTMPILKDDNLQKNKYFDKKQAITHLKNLGTCIKKNISLQKLIKDDEEYILYKKIIQRYLDEK